MISAQDYPALYRSTDRNSKSLQAQHFGLLLLSLVCLVIAGAMAAFPIHLTAWWVVAAFLNLAVLVATISTMVLKPQSRWYETRAIAESVKTLSWRFVMRARPFDLEDKRSHELFADRINAVLQEHRHLGADIAPTHGVDQITPEMSRIRGLSFAERTSIYVSRRVDDQARWYAKRAGEHRKHMRASLVVLLALIFIAVTLLILRAARPTIEMPFSDVAITASLALLAWLQAKRFPELIASYSLAAHEIGTIKLRGGQVTSENTLSEYVVDAEGAFSREHTQWIAKLDS